MQYNTIFILFFAFLTVTKLHIVSLVSLKLIETICIKLLFRIYDLNVVNIHVQCFPSIISYTIKIYFKEVYQKPEILDLSAGSDDETDSCTIQSTPCYTDSSIEHLIKLPTNVPEREDRVLVVILLSITFFVQVREIQYVSFLQYHSALHLWNIIVNQ